MNSINLVGNVGNFELRQTNSGEPILNFSLAINRQYKREGQPEVDWFACSLFGKRAASVSKFFKNGAKIGVTGRGEWRDWTDLAGNKRKDLTVIADRIDLIGNLNKEGYEASDAADLPY